MFNLSRPGISTSPGPRLPSCWATITLIVSSADVACFLLRPLFSARVVTNWDLLILLSDISYLLCLSIVLLTVKTFLLPVGLRNLLNHFGSFFRLVSARRHICLGNDP